MTTSIDGTNVQDVTIDGERTLQITVDNDIVFNKLPRFLVTGGSNGTIYYTNRAYVFDGYNYTRVNDFPVSPELGVRTETGVNGDPLGISVKFGAGDGIYEYSNGSWTLADDGTTIIQDDATTYSDSNGLLWIGGENSVSYFNPNLHDRLQNAYDYGASGGVRRPGIVENPFDRGILSIGGTNDYADMDLVVKLDENGRYDLMSTQYRHGNPSTFINPSGNVVILDYYNQSEVYDGNSFSDYNHPLPVYEGFDVVKEGNTVVLWRGYDPDTNSNATQNIQMYDGTEWFSAAIGFPDGFDGFAAPL